MRIYKYLYFRLLCFFVKQKHNADIAHLNATTFLAFLIWINVITLPYLINDIFKKDLILIPGIKLWIVVAFLFLIGINYFLLVYKKKYLKIYDEFKNESNKKRWIGTIFIFLYMIVSFGLLILSALALQKR